MDLRFPIGEFVPPASYSDGGRAEWISRIESAPSELRAAVAGLDDSQLDTPYRPEGWTVRQLVHHLADSHINSICRFKLALTEQTPTIRPRHGDEGAGPPRRIHILGASGSGTTTLGAALARRLGYDHFDTDDFYWEQTDPPFQHSRPVVERQRLLGAAIEDSDAWVLSGSLVSWSGPFLPLFDVAIFLRLPSDIRMSRLRERELARYGADRLAPGGDMHEIDRKFLEWAEQYDTADTSMRSLALHEAWLADLPAPVIRLDGLLATTEQIDQLLALFATDTFKLS